MDKMARALRVRRAIFFLAVLLSMAIFLSPASGILAAKEWVASWLSSEAVLYAMDASDYSDKVIHAGLFAILGWLAVRSWLAAQQRSFALGGLVLFGVLTEGLQGYIPGRSVSLHDWLADVAGLVVGAMVVVARRSNARPGERSWA